MKRTIFITISSLVLFTAFSLWLYLLLFGTPTEVREAFTNIGLGGREATPIEAVDNLVAEERQVNINTDTLSQLTTKAVAGFGFVTMSSSSTAILYAEKGTGYVYQINLTGGEEVRLLQKTLVSVNNAYFSPDGSAVVLVADGPEGRVAYLEELDTNKPAHQFPRAADNIDLTSSRLVKYTITSEEGTLGYSYNLDTAETNQLFETDLTDIVALWKGDDAFIYSRTAPNLRGALYQISGNFLERINSGGLSFSALVNPIFLNSRIETFFDTETRQLISRAESGDSNPVLAVTALADKCAFDPTDSRRIWCASPLNRLGAEDQTDWYKGLVSLSDFLWLIDLETGEARVEEDFLANTGRQIDVLDLTIDQDGGQLLFKNKIDDTLWLKHLNP